MPNIYRVPEELTSPKIAAAMKLGGFGSEVFDDNEYRPGGWAGFCSPVNWDSMQAARAAGEDWYYADHAYFERHRFYRITKNAYQHNGIGKPDFRRLARWWPKPLPFHKSGSKVIICPQSQSHLDRRGDPHWLERTLDTIHRYTDRDVIVRSKRDPGVLARMMPDAWAVVCHSSNAAVEALMHGVPAFTTAECAAYDMTGHDLTDIEYPIYPDGRHEWAAVLAANQWTLDEIAKGKAWRALQG